MKVTTIVTLLVAVVYAMCLLVIDVPAEKSIVIFWLKWKEFQLPFEVSPWWNLLFFPFLIILHSNAQNQNLIVGKEPKTGSFEIKTKYQIRISLYLVRVVSLFMGIGTMILGCVMSLVFAIFNLHLPELNILSLFPLSIILYLVTYITLGISLQFVDSLLWDKVVSDVKADGVSQLEKYTVTSTAYSKLSIASSLPFLFGATLAFIVRFTLDYISKLKIRVSYKAN